MSWLNNIDKVYLVNLLKREDRLLESAKLLEEYEIPYSIFTAIEKPKGAEGLRDTMNLIFKEAIENDYDCILVFEDDVKFMEEKWWVHEVMNMVFNQLPENYHLCYLGGQPTNGYPNFYSPNLLPAYKYFATQSVIYSKQGIKEIVNRGMDYPIDNWLVSEIQTLGQCYAIDPLLCSQRKGYSDIAKNVIDWNPFIHQRHIQKVNEIKRK